MTAVVVETKEERAKLNNRTTEEIILRKACDSALKLIQDGRAEEAVVVLEAAILTADTVAREFGR